MFRASQEALTGDCGRISSIVIKKIRLFRYPFHNMASDSRLLVQLAQDLSESLQSEHRFQRMVEAILQVLPADAVTLLRVQEGELLPLAMHGLSADALGRRFPRAEHPRLDAICRHDGPLVFPPGCDLPDPFDGLLADAPELTHTVHACAGCPLTVEGELVGVLTLDALDAGAFDRIDPDLLAALGALAGAALHTAALVEGLEETAQRQVSVARHLTRGSAQRHGSYLLGNSESMERLRDEVRILGRSELPVLVTGETGAGKEVAVHMLHVESRRAEQALIYLNCAALPESVAESELFGHEEGAFTDARRRRLGKFQVADGATLFLDEIGELPLAIQAKLLRVLQSGEVQSVGSDRPRKVDVRLFAATNRDLRAEVAAGRFRADLLHRLDVCRLHLPPLREHVDDLPLLAGSLCDDLRRQLGCGPIRVHPDALAGLANYAWPGNVRELANVLSRASLRALPAHASEDRLILEPQHFGPEFSSQAPSAPSTSESSLPTPPLQGDLREAVDAYERTLIEAALDRHDGVWAAAARELGLHRSNLHRLAVRLGLLPEGQA